MSEQYLAELMAFFAKSAASTKPHSGCIQRVDKPETSHAKKEEGPDGKRGRY